MQTAKQPVIVAGVSIAIRRQRWLVTEQESTPFGGASWEPAEMKISAARRVIAFLENRRVLYEPREMEASSHCVHSVIEIRHRLSDELGKLDGKNSDLTAPRIQLDTDGE